MSAVNFELLPLQAQTASMAGGTIDVAGLKEMEVFVRLTTGSGSGTIVFSVYLEGSDDDGTTWYELVADTVLENTGTGPDPTVGTNKRNIVTKTAVVTTETKWTAQYTRFPDKVRARVLLSGGTTPSETIGVKAVGKN